MKLSKLSIQTVPASLPSLASFIALYIGAGTPSSPKELGRINCFVGDEGVPAPSIILNSYSIIEFVSLIAAEAGDLRYYNDL